MKRLLVLLFLLAPVPNLLANGTATGLVIDVATSTPLSGVSVGFSGIDINFYGLAVTDETGAYSVDLPAGRYGAGVVATGYVFQVYNNLNCIASCAPSNGTPIQIQDGSTTAGIDFALQPAGQIGGFVTDNNGLPLAGVVVDVFLEATQVASTQTDSGGSYLIDHLEPGRQYMASTWSQFQYIDELYNNIVCYPRCSLAGGTPIPVSAGVVSQVNFALAHGGTISGAVTAGGVGSPGVEVHIFDTSGLDVGLGQSGGGGVFTTTALPPGTYYARTRNLLGYVDETFPNIPCSDNCNAYCDPTSGTPIPVLEGVNTSGINFTLDHGGGISGRVVDAATSTPLSGKEIEVYDAHGLVIGRTVYSDNSGTYVIQGLLPGAYYLFANEHNSEYLPQVYSQQFCSQARNCAPTTGTPVTVTANAITGNVDIAMVKGGKIQGTITDAQTGAPVDASITVYDSKKNRIGPADVTTGAFTARALKTGIYYLTATNYSGPYLDQVYSGRPCNRQPCDLSQATPISVTAGATASASFQLGKGGSVSGTIIDSTTGLPLQSVDVRVLDKTGHRVSSGTTDSDGSYSTSGAIPPGGYYYVVTNSRGKYLDQIYPGIPCMGGTCDLGTGTVVHIEAGAVVTANFSLSKGQAIAGTVTDGETAFPVRFAYIRVYDSLRRQVSTSLPYSNIFGMYSAGGLLPGTYYVTANIIFGSTLDYVGQLYNGFPCSGPLCDVTSGTPVVVLAGADTTGIDFTLHRGGNVSGTVRDARTGAGIQYESVIILDQGWNVLSYGGTDCAGNYTTAANLPSGNYYAITSSQWDYVEKRYQDASCVNLPDCAAAVGTPIAVVQGQNTTGIDFTLRPTNTILFLDDFEDSVLSTRWKYLGGSWSETGGNLSGQSQGKGMAIADPAYSGCKVCTFEAVMNAAAGSASLLGWYSNSNTYVELKMDPAADRWYLLQRRDGVVVASGTKQTPIDPGVNYRAAITYDGLLFRVSVNGSFLFSVRAAGSPKGTGGFQISGGSGLFGEILVY